MSSVTVKFKLSETGRKASLIAGGNGKQFQEIVVKQGDAEFERAVGMAAIGFDGSATVDYRFVDGNNVAGDSKDWDQLPTATEVLEDRQAVIDRLARVKIAKHEEAVQEWLAKPAEEWLNSRFELPCRGYSQYTRWYPSDSRLDGKAAEAKALAEKLIAEEAARKEAEAEKNKLKKEQEKAQKEAGLEKLKAWGTEHGSELLKARIENGFDFEGLARTEFATSIVGPIVRDTDGIGYSSTDECDDCEERTNPTLNEIRLFKLIKEKIGDAGVVELYRRKYSDEDGEASWVTECDIAVKCPDGVDKEVYLELQS